MNTIYGSVKLRPTRIGFLVRPTDRKAVSRVMRLNTCLWGGTFNPIIPVGRLPAIWREKHPALRRPDREVSQAYLEFFEPDVLVEAESGLAKRVGYGALEGDVWTKQLITLHEFAEQENDRNSGFAFGLPVTDVYAARHANEQQFVRREERPWYRFAEGPLARFCETAFGCFPADARTEHFGRSYDRVFTPEITDASSERWLSIFRDGAAYPFEPTKHKLELTSFDLRETTFFVFDHNNTADLIEFWNLRCIERDPYPIPLCWLSELRSVVVGAINRTHRPIPNNPFGTKFRSRIIFGHSIPEDEAARICREVLSECASGSFYWSYSYHPRLLSDPIEPKFSRIDLSTGKRDFQITPNDDLSVQVESLAPDFADRFGGGKHRWANVINLSKFGSDQIATVYPANLRDRRRPRILSSGLSRPIVSREGWVVGQEHKGLPEHLKLQRSEEAICDWLHEKGFKARPSGAGRIAQQMLKNLGGLWDTHVICDAETIKLLDDIAAQVVVRENGQFLSHRTFEGRSTDVGRLGSLVKRRSKMLPRVSVDDFTKRGIVKLGLLVECPQCTHRNWYALDRLSYNVDCERCLGKFPFPQGNTRRSLWRYRVTGPFSVPNFAEGAYSVALTLALFRTKLSGGDAQLVYSTGLELEKGPRIREVDFVFWYREASLWGHQAEPRLVIGEAKSFARRAVTEADVDGLRELAKELSGTILVVSVLKDAFDPKERKLLQRLAKWGWHRIDGRMRAPLIVLTGVELFAEFNVQAEWKKRGLIADANHLDIFRNLEEFAVATQRIHLGIDAWQERRRQRRETKAN